MNIKSPLVVGYKGEIGSFILQGLLRTMPKALNIWCYDINENESECIDRINKSNTIFLCVPIQDTIKWFKKHRNLLKNKTVIEQCSLKTFLYEGKNKWISSSNDFSLLSMHILFRPSVTALTEKRNVIILNHYDWRVIEYDIEQITQAKIIKLNNHILHDKTMAIQQALVHRVLLTLNDVIHMPVKTYIGNKVEELGDRIKKGDPVLYGIIQRNKYLKEIINTFNKKLDNFKI